MKRYYFILVLSILSALQSYAQVETHYYQEGDTTNVLPDYIFHKQNGITIKMPAFDLEKMRKEDAEMEGTDAPYRFGKGFDVSYTLSDGLWQDVDGGRLWALTFESEGALSLNYIFENIFLPDGANLFIVNHDNTVVYGPVTSEVCVPRESTFLTDVIPGASSTIYLFEPLTKINESTLTIRRVVHGYRGFDFKQVERSLGDASSCNINVACYPAYEKESKGIALVMLSNGEELCSGSLLMSTNLSFDPYFLTAFHCIDTNKNKELSDSEKQAAKNWMFKFCFKKTTCNGNTLATSYTYNKADFCSAWKNTDFALMKLKSSVSNNTNLTWFGWDKSSSTPTSGVGIHHPQGDVMKISFDYDTFSTYSNFGGTDNFWLLNYDDGIVEHGSSGSPILNESKRVVGQLYGNSFYTHNLPYCDQPRAEYGRFNLSWIGDSTNDTRLSNWLDPIGTGQTTTDSSHPIYISGSNLVCRNSSGSYSVSNLPSGYTVTWSSSNPLSVSLQTSGNNCFLTHNYIISHKVTLTATLYRGSQMIRTVTKNVVCHGDIIIRYSQAATSDHPAIVNQLVDNSRVIMVTQNVPATITSANFLGMNVSCNYSSVASWSYDGNQTITFTYPSTGIGGTGLIFSASGSPNCNDFQVTALPYPSGQRKSLIVNNSGNRLELSIVPLSDADNEQTDKNLLWTLNVYEVSTGRKIFSQDYDTSQCTVDISGWKQGVYILQAVVGDEITYEKIKI